MSLLLFWPEQVTFSGSGASTAAPATSAASAELVFSGAGASTTAPATSAATGEEIFSGAGASDATPGISSASAELVFSGAGGGTASAATSTATGEETFSATSDAVAAPATSGAVCELVFDASSSSTAGAAISDGAGEIPVAQAPSSVGVHPFVWLFHERKETPPEVTAHGESVQAPGTSAATGSVINPVIASGASRATAARGLIRSRTISALTARGCSIQLRPIAHAKARVRNPVLPRVHYPPTNRLDQPAPLSDDELLAVLTLIE